MRKYFFSIQGEKRRHSPFFYVEAFQRSIEEKDKLKMDDLFLCFALSKERGERIWVLAVSKILFKLANISGTSMETTSNDSCPYVYPWLHIKW